jgi:hypothetical protein
MSEIRMIKIEILRAGPDHNQLISPLTPYLAFTDTDGPVTITIPFEQHQLLTRLERLRYYIHEIEVAPEQREAELREIGTIIGKILGQIPSLLSEIGSIQPDQCKLVHLRLSLAPFELGLVPFETAISPEGFPSSGSPLLLQSSVPMTMSREARHGRPHPVNWNRKPRILFVFASPPGLAGVPAQNHLIALRRAIAPWVAIHDSVEKRIESVKDILTVLPNATLDQIRQACSHTEYTHVHILGHGAPFENAGEKRYGLALISTQDPSRIDVVDGERLAIALTSFRSTATKECRRPTVLSLSTCDSGNTGSILIPGGSIAHELHAAGIPWIFASQFPLWMGASTLFTEILYKRLLMGADPRFVLYELRQRLRTSCPETHDWASIVAYATVPEQFEDRVTDFFNEQTRKRIEIKFGRIDQILQDWTDENNENRKTEIKDLRDSIRRDLSEWRDILSVSENPKTLALRRNIGAASEKRFGIIDTRLSDDKQSIEAYRKARDLYFEGFKADTSNQWPLTQYLSMCVIIRTLEGKEPEDFQADHASQWIMARELCRIQVEKENIIDRAWGFSSLAELELLGSVYNRQKFNKQESTGEIIRCCKELLTLCRDDRFPLDSTVRQFRRYKEVWTNELWAELAVAALTVLDENRDKSNSGSCV